MIYYIQNHYYGIVVNLSTCTN